MDALWLIQSPAAPDGGWGTWVPVVSAVAAALTVLATAVINRRGGHRDFLGDVLKENEYLRGRDHEREKEIIRLNDQNRTLGRENVDLLRADHHDILERLEKLTLRLERISGRDS